MGSRVSAEFVWRGCLLGAAAILLSACAAGTEEAQPAPAPPQVIATPAPPSPTAPEPSPPAGSLAPPAVAEQPAPEAPAAPATPPPPAPGARGPIEITAVDVQEAGPAGLVVTVVADGPIASYESFSLPDPPRLILDIPNAIHAVRQPIRARTPLLTAIRSSQYRERPVKIVRMVLDLRSMLPYQVTTADNQLRAQLGSAVGAPAPPTVAAPPAPGAAPAGKVTRVDFQSVRGRQRIVIGTRGRVTYNVRESSEPLRLLVDVTGAQLDPAGARTLDLRQVTSPVSRLQADQYRTTPEPVVRVIADLRSPTRYAVHQTSSAILVDLQAPPLAAAPAAPAPSAPPAPPAAPPPAPSAAEAPPEVAAPPAAEAPPEVAAPPTLPAPPAAPPPAPPVAVTEAPPAPPLAEAPRARRRVGRSRRLSMDFRDADINNLLRIIAEVSGMNVVAGGDVRGKVTIRLVNVEWQQALDVILKINNLGYELDGNIIRVAPLAKLQAERADKTKARDTERQLEPLVTKVLPVNYAKASEVVKNLDRLKTPGRADASIAVDDRTNTLIIKETAASLRNMESLLRRLDIPTPQVLIEARIVEATRSFSQSLGIEWGFAFNSFLKSGAADKALTPVSVFTSQVGTTLTAPTDTVPLGISFPAAGTSPAALGIIAGSLANNNLLGVRLSAAEQEGRVRTLSAPKVATLDNQEAEIRQGTQVPYTTVDSSGRTVIAFQDAFIRMKVTPHITNDRRVSMKVEAERSFPGERIDYSGGFAFILEQRKASTNILVSNGATIVIGGLMQTTENQAESGLPWLKDVPFLGLFFKNQSVGPNQKTELLIFLTPTILEEPRLS